MDEAWAYIKLFIIAPLVIVAISGGATYLMTGEWPNVPTSDDPRCGSGRLTYDC